MQQVLPTRPHKRSELRLSFSVPMPVHTPSYRLATRKVPLSRLRRAEALIGTVNVPKPIVRGGVKLR